LFQNIQYTGYELENPVFVLYFISETGKAVNFKLKSLQHLSLAGAAGFKASCFGQKPNLIFFFHFQKNWETKFLLKILKFPRHYKEPFRVGLFYWVKICR